MSLQGARPPSESEAWGLCYGRHSSADTEDGAALVTAETSSSTCTALGAVWSGRLLCSRAPISADPGDRVLPSVLTREAECSHQC